MFAKDRLHVINLNQLKLKVKANYKKDEEITTNFEPSNEEDVVNQAYLYSKLAKVKGRS